MAATAQRCFLLLSDSQFWVIEIAGKAISFSTLKIHRDSIIYCNAYICEHNKNAHRTNLLIFKKSSLSAS